MPVAAAQPTFSVAAASFATALAVSISAPFAATFDALPSRVYAGGVT